MLPCTYVAYHFHRQDAAVSLKSHFQDSLKACRDNLTKRRSIQKRWVVSRQKSSHSTLTRQKTTTLDDGFRQASSDCSVS